MYPGNDPKYKDLKPEEIPQTECLKVRDASGMNLGCIWRILKRLHMEKQGCCLSPMLGGTVVELEKIREEKRKKRIDPLHRKIELILFVGK